MGYFEELQHLLQEEQHFDKLQHEDLIFRRSLQERKSSGVTWYPIAITQSEMGRGDYLTITLNRTSNLEDGHKFRFGMPVSLFSNHDASQDRLNGTISFVNRETMRIAFRSDELPDWSRRGKLGVDLLFDENSYKEMNIALSTAKDFSANVQEGAFVRQLIGENKLIFKSSHAIYQDSNLNESQNKAISNILEYNPLTILHGPPGTGKTTTLIHAVKALLKQQNKQILIVAPSNTAVDVLTERLDAEGVSVVRMGNAVKVSEHLQNLTLDAKIQQHPANKEAKTLEKQARAYADMAHKYKRSFGRSEREQRKALFDESRKIRKEIDKIQDYIVEDILDKSSVVTATLVGSNHYSIREREYETVIIDEAAQALEPACWIPILKAKNIVLAGDHLQLPPTVKSSHKSSEGLYITLFEKLIDLYPEAVSLLNVQYRMNEQIMKYPSQALYDNALIADASVANWTLQEDFSPVTFIDTAGAGFDEKIEDDAICNEEEAYFLRNHLKETLISLNRSYTLDNFPNIGIVAPYRKQSQLLKEIIRNDESIKEFTNFIKIHTIDSFQGQEKDIIYISLTRSNNQQNIGFLADVRRMNVAMTRARKKLIVIGDSSTIGQHYFYKGFIDFTSDINSYHSAWEWDFTNND